MDPYRLSASNPTAGWRSVCDQFAAVGVNERERNYAVTGT